MHHFHLIRYFTFYIYSSQFACMRVCVTFSLYNAIKSKCIQFSLNRSTFRDNWIHNENVSVCVTEIDKCHNIQCDIFICFWSFKYFCICITKNGVLFCITKHDAGAVLIIAAISNEIYIFHFSSNGTFFVIYLIKSIKRRVIKTK